MTSERQITTIDAGAIAEAIDQMMAIVGSALDPARLQTLLGEARTTLARIAPDRVLVGLALWADVLRIVRSTMIVDGAVSDRELIAAQPLLLAAARRFARYLPRYAGLEPLDLDSARTMIHSFANDDGAFGFLDGPTSWSGLELCRQTALAGDGEALKIYEQLALRLFDDIARLDGLGAGEQTARSKLKAMLADRVAIVGAMPAVDNRTAAFLRSGVEVFAPVVYAHRITARDSADVEMVHAEAREAFESIVARATSESRQGAGRMLLILGESGSGKTHLLRAMRASLHGRRRGYAAYVQLHSLNEDYASYALRQLISALDGAYDEPDEMRSGLLLLSNAMVEQLGPHSADDVAALQADSNEPGSETTDRINRLTDRLLELPQFSTFATDFLRVMVVLQQRDPRLNTRANQWLRGEDLGAHDRARLGDLIPRTNPDDALRTIGELASAMWRTQQSALVFLLDQVEDHRRCAF
jgi:energy-coupling factor transporter ATP-binding protein EcfA2